jgi:hypothetical protein
MTNGGTVKADATASTAAQMGTRDMEQTKHPTPVVRHVWNTGAHYTAEGQIITGLLYDDGTVLFFDHSRLIAGRMQTTLASTCPATVLRSAVMDAYLRNRYEMDMRASSLPRHAFKVDQLVTVKSGGVYRVMGLRSDLHDKLKGELGYDIIGQRNGRDFGPIRLSRESSLRAAEGGR